MSFLPFIFLTCCSAILNTDIEGHVKLCLNNCQEANETNGEDKNGPPQPVLLVVHEAHAVSDEHDDALHSLVGAKVLLPPECSTDS